MRGALVGVPAPGPALESGQAQVSGPAREPEQAQVSGPALVSEPARESEQAQVSGLARESEQAQVPVSGQEPAMAWAPEPLGGVAPARAGVVQAWAARVWGVPASVVLVLAARA